MKVRSFIMASAAAALFVAGAGVAAGDHHEGGEAKVKCEGANGCKGKSACKTDASACAGHNECKGKGFVMLSQEECDAAKAAASDE